MFFLTTLVVALAALAVTESQECDGETTRTCEECVALTEWGTKCNFCKADKRCQGDTDISSAFSCAGGFTTDAAGCTATPAPTAAPSCDGETTRTCEQCVALSEGVSKCNFCRSDNRCQGDLDLTSTFSCAGGYANSVESCRATPAPPSLPSCDGETNRTCEECVALTEGLTKCNFCKSDKRCQGDLDISTSFACTGGYSNSVESCRATPAPTAELVCDGETSRTCEECVALTEGVGKCNFCKSDNRCQGNLDLTSSFACAGGYTTDVAGCSMTPVPPPEPYCDGEVTTCSVCTSKSEFFLGKCNWCPDTGKCNGNIDLSNVNGACASGYKGSCDDVTTDPNFKFNCEQCPGNCNTGCVKTHSNGLIFCLRGELQIINGMCMTNASATGCCAPGQPGDTPMPVRSGPLRPTFANICFEYRAGCDSPADFCAYKAKYMACATRSDRCGDYNVLSDQFDKKCPAIKCQCSSVPNSCLSDGSQVAVQCTAPGQVQIMGDNCGQCKDCECEKRCCSTTCTGKSMEIDVAKFVCNANNDITMAECKCKKSGAATTSIAAMALIVMIVTMML